MADKRPPDSKEAKAEDFVALILANQTRIHNFIRSLISNKSDADDLFQKTSVVLWKKFDQYQPGTNFASWAMRVGYFEVCDYRKKMARARVTFSQDVFDALAEKVSEVAVQEDQRHDALVVCIDGLNDKNRELVRLRYIEDLSVDDVSKQIGRPPKTVYRILSQVRKWLMNCIETRMTNEPVA
ncbi:MAG: RNA polymerase sigma-70 factor (ECF subfamily) [Verrucomicrobiales bacterium]|jgi:RNA polymerase sigma-70 factor (ECF subfamily)